MANQRTYSITINGLTESVKAVDALNDSLKNLEERIKSLEGKTVNVGAKSSGGGSKSSSTSSLSEEAKLEKQIAQLEEKRIAHSKQIYQNYLAAKDVLAETDKDQKQIAASERLAAKSYSNTISGMKQELADIKQVMQTVDLGDSGKMKEMVDRANELNSKLKEIEQSYGQFSRNVGNYASAADGFQKVAINVGGTVREFNNAREASRTLNNELKAMAVNGQTDTEEFKKLRQTVMELDSAIADAKKPMDAFMDAMESFTAIASVSQGFSALFGIDDTEIQRSIQKLVALQNILKGIETINKQINTKEGIGKWLAPFNTGIDTATKKALVYNRAILGTGTAAKAAAVGVKVFSKALKVAFSAGILIVVDLLIEGLMKLVESFNKVDEAAERQKETQKQMAEAYGNAQGKLIKYKTVVDNFNGSKKQEKKLVEELNSEFGATLGTYKSLAEWQDVLKRKGDAYIQTLVNQAKAQAALNEVTAAYMNLEDVKQKAASGEYSHWYQTEAGDRRRAANEIEKANQRIADAENRLKTIISENEEYAKKHGLGDFAPQITKNGKKSADAAKKAQEDIRKKQIDAMKDGLNKTLMQLDEEERQTLNKLRENGNKTSQLVKQTQEAYTQLRINAISEYLNKLTKTVEDSQKKIAGIRFQIDTKDIELQVNEIEELIRQMTDNVAPINNTLTTKLEYEASANGFKQKDLFFANLFNVKKNKAATQGEIKEYYKWLEAYVSTLSEEVKQKLSYQNIGTGELEIDYKEVEKYIEEHFKRELDLISSYGYQGIATLSSSFALRMGALREYDKDYIDEIGRTLEDEQSLRKEAAKKDEENQIKSLDESYRTERNALEMRKVEIENSLAAISKLNIDENEKLKESFKKEHAEEIKNLEETNAFKIETYGDYYKSLQMSLEKQQKKTNEQLEEIEVQHGEKMAQIHTEYGQKLTQIEVDIDNRRMQNKQRYYDKQLSNYRDFLSKINDEAAKQPVTDTAGFGIVNIVQTKRNYTEILKAAKVTMDGIKADKDKLNKDFQNGLISPENYNATLNQLNDLEKETSQTAKTVTDNYKRVNADFVQSLQMYLQEALNSFNTIMGAVWDAQEVQFDKEQEAIDKENEMLREKLDEQQEIIEEHKNNVDSIEDELANSRGDRRQHLIDQLNAEMEAERAAQKEKERLAKLEEANKKKQEKLDKERKKAQYKRDLIQAIVNGAMAVTYAAMNTWPIPAIPMMALAGATTAAQIAIMSANKPYAKGGQLDGGLIHGKRHSEGGVPVGNTGIEVEGSEYIIRRASTAPNLGLLDFINKSQRKLNLNDFIEFYSSGTIKKSIMKMSPKKAYADGGYIPPTLSNNIDLDDRLMSAFENYSNRPVVVSVVDITNKQDDVRRVQALAGL